MHLFGYSQVQHITHRLQMGMSIPIPLVRGDEEAVQAVQETATSFEPLRMGCWEAKASWAKTSGIETMHTQEQADGTWMFIGLTDKPFSLLYRQVCAPLSVHRQKLDAGLHSNGLLPGI